MFTTSAKSIFVTLLATIISIDVDVMPLFAQSSPQQDAVSAVGFQRNRNYFSPESFEHYDTVSGNVLLSFTDLSLPGNAGRGLVFQRTYNNQRAVAGQITRWNFGFPGMVMRVIEKPVPPNVNFNDDPGIMMGTTPEFEMADGSIQKTLYVGRPNAATAAIAVVRSNSFYLYDRQFHSVKMPDGVVCMYDPTTGRLLSFQDPFGNLVELVWGAESVIVTQRLGGGQDRVITVALDEAGRVTAMQFGNRTWTYTYSHQMGTGRDITSVALPEGPGWTFTYDSSDLKTITTPNGGLITYTYADVAFPDPTMMFPDINQHSLVARDSEGRDVQPGHWGIEWLAEPGSSFAWSTHIVTPSGGRVVYEHGILVVNEDIDKVIGGNFGVKKRSIFDGQQRVDFEEYQFVALPTVQFSAPTAWWGTAEIQRRDQERDGRTYSNVYVFSTQNFADYHNPITVLDGGDIGRITQFTYEHLLSPRFVVGLPATKEVSITNGPLTSGSWIHDAATGFTTSATVAGITTSFEKDALGNVSRVTKANGKSTSYIYSWGQIHDVITAEHTTSREVNPDGTMASETLAGRTTSYQYDKLFRVTQVQPPGGTNLIVTDYDPNGAWIRTTRGSSITTTALD
jgi:hypothetical protein